VLVPAVLDAGVVAVVEVVLGAGAAAAAAVLDSGLSEIACILTWT
jgi:hypothetical protein